MDKPLQATETDEQGAGTYTQSLEDGGKATQSGFRNCEPRANSTAHPLSAPVFTEHLPMPAAGLGTAESKRKPQSAPPRPFHLQGKMSDAFRKALIHFHQT